MAARTRTVPNRPGPASVRQPASHRTLLDALAGQLMTHDPNGELLGGGVDLGRLAEDAATHILDAGGSWVEQLGPFYDGAAVRSLLTRDGEPISRQAVHKRRGLLALATGSGQVVYPVFQFDGRQPAPGLGQVLEALPETLVSRWTVASWLSSPDVDLNGERPIDVLHGGGPEGAAGVLAVARGWAAQLAAA